MEKFKVSMYTGVWKKLTLSLMDVLKELKTSVEEVTADVLGTARELELEVKPEDMTELLPSHDKTLADEQRKWFLETATTPEEDVLKTVEMKTRDLEYYIYLFDKTVAGFGRADSNFISSIVNKMLPNSIAC